MSFEYHVTDNQYYNFICGLHAGLKLKDLTVPAIDTNLVLHSIGVGGHTTIGLMIPQILYDDSINTFLIPVSVHDVNIGYSGFSVNIKLDSKRLRFNGVVAGDFGTISDGTENTDIRYTYSNGNFKARGIRNSSIVFNDPIILFYIDVTVIDTVTKNNPITLNFIDKSFSNLEYCTLLTWVQLDDGSWYNYFITPLDNISGAIISRDEKSKNELNNKESIGDDKVIAASASPSGVYVGEAHTAPGEQGVVPIYANSNIDDNFPYSGVHCIVVVKDDVSMFNYINVVGTGGFSVDVTKTILDDGNIQLDILATRDKALIDSVTFCYIDYQINTGNNNYIIPLSNNLSELIN